jgi:hypothetical protein
MRAGVLVALLGCAVSCRNTVTVTCDLGLMVEAELGGLDQQVADGGATGSFSDCSGLVGDPPTAEGFAAAQYCAVTAVGAGRAFKLVYAVPATGQNLRAAFTGVPTANGLRVRAYAYSGDFPGHPDDANPSVSMRTCLGTPPLVDTATVIAGGCRPDVGRPCLKCNLPTAGTLLCGYQQ